MEYVGVAIVVLGFGYFLYRKYKDSRKYTAPGTGSGGRSPHTRPNRPIDIP